MTTRERRERYMRSVSLTHLLIAVVALIECLLLVTFTTYSWIESSSSLVITSNNIDMAIAKNLAYQVNLGNGGLVNLSGSPIQNSVLVDHAYYRNVINFSFARSSSPDGKTFYFPYKEGNKEKYRAGDTADYNTSYSYLDFELKNTGAQKLLYFDYSTLFNYDSGSATDGTGGTTDEQTIIKNAMRISVQQVDVDSNSAEPAPVIFSNLGGNTTAINGAWDGTDSAPTATVSAEKISDYVTPTSNSITSPVLISERGVAADPDHGIEEEAQIDHVSVRVWFEMKDSGLQTYLSNLSTAENINAFYQRLASSKISLTFSLAAQNVFVDDIFFDDYAFSVLDDYRGHHVTDETSSYSLYFHAFDDELGSDPSSSANYRNFAMVSVGSSSSPEGAKRWKATLSADHVLDHLDYRNVNNTVSNTYFYYGSPDGSQMAYKWNLTDLLGGNNFIVHTDHEDPNDESTPITEKYLDNANKYIRNLGVVRSTTQNTYNMGVNATQGYAEFYTNNSASMTLLTIKDHATGFTGGDYNLTAYGYDPIGYITNSAGSKPLNNVFANLSSDPALTSSDVSHFDGLYYLDVPKTYHNNGDDELLTIIFDNGYSDSSNQTVDISVNSELDTLDGTCYKPNGNAGNGKITVTKYTGSALPLTKIDDEDYVRIYFYNNIGRDSNGYTQYHHDPWTSVKLFALYQGDKANSPWSDGNRGIEMKRTPTYAYTQNYDDLYINQTASTDTTNSSQAATAKQTIRPYYNTTDACYYAYVPSTWLESGNNTVIHYNNTDHYYNDAADKLRFAIGTAQTTNVGTAEAPDNQYIYTMLGYSDAAALNTFGSGTAGIGVGTWDKTTKVKFDTELIDSSIFAANVYKLAFKDGNDWTDYPMAPVSGTYGMTFEAYLPDSCLTNSSEAHNARFTRAASVATAAGNTFNGYWYPQSSFSANDDTYYAVPTLASNDSESSDTPSAVRGYFHVAVLNDSTYENLIYSIINDDLEPGSSLVYSFGSQTDTMAYVNTTPDPDVPVFANNTNGLPYLVPGSTRRWIIPIEASTTSITYTWTPYSGTTFTYTHNLADGIYYNISEGH